MTHVTLIRPPLMFPKFRPDGSINVIPPLGIAYLAATLRTAGHEITCIDSPGEALASFRESELDPRLVEQGLSLQQIVARIPENTQVIGLSCMFSYEWFYMIELIRAIRAQFPKPFLVLGGEHATADHEFILKSMPEVDACVLGEGEDKMLALVDALEMGIPKRDLPGAAVCDSGQILRNEEKEYRIKNVNTIPRPAWDLFPMAQYLSVDHGGPGLRSIPMLASRGCPYKCAFCSSPKMWTTRWKSRDIDDVIGEIKTYIREYKINRVEFYDLTLVMNETWIKEFCQKLIAENLRISWAMPTGTRTENLTKDVLSLMKESGCAKITYPLETGNPKVCEIIRKRINYARSLASMKNAVKAGVVVKTNIIIGFPFQNLRDVIKEYLFAIRLAWIGANDIAFFNFVPYPGSELHDQLVSQGKIVKDKNYPQWLRQVFPANFSDCQSWCPKFSGTTLQILCLMGIAQFYIFQFLFRPQRLLLFAYRLCKKKPLTLLETWAMGALRRRSHSRGKTPMSMNAVFNTKIEL
jgi:anaerobic magnesium-protoporphyrin IX monomethyl ester cyclase